MMRYLGVMFVLLGLITSCSSSQAANTAIPNSALNGCLSQLAPPKLDSATLSVTGNRAGSDLINHQQLAVGQTVEIRLGANIRWAVSTMPAADLLQVQPPAGWYSDSDGMCVWRYRATGTGVAKLYFTGGLVCPPKSACPAIASIAQFEFTIY